MKTGKFADDDRKHTYRQQAYMEKNIKFCTNVSA